MQPRFVVLGDLKMWLSHASSMAQSAFQFQMAKIQTAPLSIISLVAFPWSVTATITAFLLVNPQTHLCAHRFLLCLRKTGMICKSHGGQYCSVI